MTKLLVWSMTYAILVCIGVAATLSVTGACESPVQAQPPQEDERRQRRRCEEPAEWLRDASADLDTVALYLARLTVNESGWTSSRDAAAIWQVLRNSTREGEGVLETMWRHSCGQLFRPEEEGPRTWPRRLHLGEETPEGLDPAEWDGRYRDLFRRIVDYAKRLVTRAGRGPCRGPVVIWGGRCETPEGACDQPPPGFERVDCGGWTHNAFYQRDRQRPARGQRAPQVATSDSTPTLTDGIVETPAGPY